MKKLVPVLALILLIPSLSLAAAKQECLVAVRDFEEQTVLVKQSLSDKGYEIVAEDQAHLIFTKAFTNWIVTEEGRITEATAQVRYKFKNETPGLRGLSGSTSCFDGFWLSACYDYNRNGIAHFREFKATVKALPNESTSVEKATVKALAKVPVCR